MSKDKSQTGSSDKTGAAVLEQPASDAPKVLGRDTLTDSFLRGAGAGSEPDRPEDVDAFADIQFEGTRRYFIGIKPHRLATVPPVWSQKIGGIEFAYRRDQIVRSQDGSSAEMVPGAHLGRFEELTAARVRICLNAMRFVGVRWRYPPKTDPNGRPLLDYEPDTEQAPRSAKVFKFADRSGLTEKQKEAKHRRIPMNRPMPRDEPVARYFVLMPGEEIGPAGSVIDIDRMPSLEERHPILNKIHDVE